jgi:hypothetical protein
MNNESVLTWLTVFGLTAAVTYTAVSLAKSLLLNIVQVLP